MNYLNRPVLLAACVLALAACSEAPAPAADAGPTPVVTTPGAVTQPTPVDASEVEPARLKMYASDPRVQNWEGIGQRQAGLLVSNATNGYLMFGPKLPFQPGKYRVEVFGDTLSVAAGNSIVFDATSESGQKVHGKLELDENAKLVDGKPLASFEFELPNAVQDLEIRAFVTSGSSVAIHHYDVVPVTPAG